MQNFKFTLRKMKPGTLPLFLTTLFVQLGCLLFFAIVGRYDQQDANALLTHYSAVIGLASTATMCVLAIYGTVQINHLVVQHYIGTFKQQTFLLPVDRKQLFTSRLTAFAVGLILVQLLGLLVANFLFILTELFFPILLGSPWPYLNIFFQSMLVCSGLTLVIVLFSSFVGIYMGSTTKGIIASLIFVVLLSNIAALSLISFRLLTLLFTFFALVAAGVTGDLLGNAIEKADA
ncbi:hypothetical protein ACLJJ6_02765 [Pediococcus siamensis]|uniref:hypothetical protein n=1 Tax=Pediococcus siamensis TaxID=381829 RepID=UPI00399FAC59